MSETHWEEVRDEDTGESDKIRQCRIVRLRLFWEKQGILFHVACQQLQPLHPCLPQMKNASGEGNLSASVPGTCSVPDTLQSKY